MTTFNSGPVTDNQWTVLLIDDEEDIRAILSLTLQDSGYEVLLAADGQEGLALCRERKPRLVITDIKMPRMDGIQVLEAVKKIDPDIEVIVATAFGEMDLAIRALQLDASDFITKPIDDQALHLALKRAKERSISRRQLKDYTALLEKETARTAQELIALFSFQKTLIDSSMDGILACDEAEIIVVFNKRLEVILDYRAQDLLHQAQLSRFFLPLDFLAFKEALASDKQGGPNRLVLHETILLGREGQKVPVQMSVANIVIQGQEKGLVFSIRDLRELRRLESELADQARILQQDKMMALGKLAAGVAHEINNPLAGVLNYIRLMNRVLGRGPLSEDQRRNFLKYFDLIDRETERCAGIVSNLLAFSRKSAQVFGDVRLDELINRSLTLTRHKLELQNIKTEVQCPSGLPVIKGDFNQLQQCLLNFIFNAMDAMPEGGRLLLSGQYAAEKKLVLVTVKDSGPGIPEEHLPHIFEPFFTTKKEGRGVGLGLSTVFGIVERHQGRIRVASRVGEGSSFILELPVGKNIS